MKKFGFGEPFKDTESIEGQTKAMKNNYFYIDPIEKQIVYRTEQVLNSQTGQYEHKQIHDTFQYVPITETLKLILSHDFIRDYIDFESLSDEDVYLKSYRDGKSFKVHNFFRRFPKALRIQF